MMRDRLRYVALGLLAAAVLLAASFATTDPRDSVPADREAVVFWHFWGGRDRSVVDQIVARFNASQDRYFVRAVAMPGNNLDLKFFLSLAGHDPPDLVNQDDPIVADWAHRDALTPLDELAAPAEIEQLRQWLYPAARQLGEYDGRLYALCNGLDIRALYYNQTLLDEHGLQPPTTLDELDVIALKITPPISNEAASEKPGAEDSPSRFGYLPDPRRLWAWGVVFGGQFYDCATGRVTADGEPIVRALDWMASYSRRYGRQNVQAFRTGEQALTGASFPLLNDRRFALIMDGQWRVRDIAEYQSAARAAGRPHDRFGVVPLPPPTGGRSRAGWVNGNFFVVPRGSRCPQGAWQFMKFWSGFDGHEVEAAKSCAAGGWIPASPEVVRQAPFQAFLDTHPLFRTFTELAESEHQRPTPAIPVATIYQREIEAAAQTAMYRGVDPRQALGQAAKRVRARLAAVRGRRPPAPAAGGADASR